MIGRFLKCVQNEVLLPHLEVERLRALCLSTALEHDGVEIVVAGDRTDAYKALRFVEGHGVLRGLQHYEVVRRVRRLQVVENEVERRLAAAKPS